MAGKKKGRRKRKRQVSETGVVLCRLNWNSWRCHLLHIVRESAFRKRSRRIVSAKRVSRYAPATGNGLGRGGNATDDYRRVLTTHEIHCKCDTPCRLIVPRASQKCIKIVLQWLYALLLGLLTALHTR